MVCPIIVEDLNPPRQMLVEMLCEERGFFLEIADLIRGLELTILKGLMEAQNDKIWARFAVEFCWKPQSLWLLAKFPCQGSQPTERGGLFCRMSIIVYMYDRDVDDLISIAEYGQEYDKEIHCVMINNFGCK